MLPLEEPLCKTCVYFEGYQAIPGQEFGAYVCQAFPQGIPNAIYYEGGDHTKPWHEDHGIQYRPKSL